jgi:hypothetical protein
MVTYFLTIDYVLSSDPKVLAHVIHIMKIVKELLGTLEAELGCNGIEYFLCTVQ